MPGETFKDALAKIDMEFDYSPDRGWTHTILGLKEVEAAHRAEVERHTARIARLEAALRDAVDSLHDAERSLRDAADEVEDDAAAIDYHDAAELAEDAADEARAAIRARGVAKPRTGSEAPSASDEGAKS